MELCHNYESDTNVIIIYFRTEIINMQILSNGYIEKSKIGKVTNQIPCGLKTRFTYKMYLHVHTRQNTQMHELEERQKENNMQLTLER